MKEIGEYLKEVRKKNGVTINEASDDLGISVSQLENIEIGNFKAFKDIFELKKYLKSYSKYLGLDYEKILDEFNDFVFEKTSKISFEDIKNAKRNKSIRENKIRSPYTKIKQNKYDIAPIILSIMIILFVSLLVYLTLKIITSNNNRNTELARSTKIVEEKL